MVIKILKAGLGWITFALGVLPIFADYIVSIFVKDDFNGPYGPKQKTFWEGDYSNT